MDFFAKWCKPGRDYSPKVAGAIFYYMTLPAHIRENCEQAAYKDDIKKTLSDFKNEFDIDKISDFRNELSAAFSRLEQIEQIQQSSSLVKNPKSRIKE